MEAAPSAEADGHTDPLRRTLFRSPETRLENGGKTVRIVFGNGDEPAA